MSKPLARALEDLESHADDFGLPNDVREEAAVIVRRALKADLDEMFSLSVLVDAAVYAACQRNEEELTVAQFDEPGSTIARAYQCLLSELSLEPPESQRPSMYLALFASDLGVSAEVAQDAQELLAAFVDAEGYIGKDADVVAAGALYAIGRRQGEQSAITMTTLQARTDASEQAIQNRAREMVQTVD